jgi:hypothetical protein
MARLIVQSKEQQAGRVFELRPGVNRFGRSGGNDYPLNDPSVSDQHCEVLVDHDLVFVRDLGSTNGTFIDRQPVSEAMLYAGQILQIGPLEMMLEAPEPRVALPEITTEPQAAAPTVSAKLKDGYAACLNHSLRHAVWECDFCARMHCDECVRKLRRVGGAYLKFCPTCSNQCKLSPWAEMVSKKKRSLIGKVVQKIRSGLKLTRQLLRA